MAADDPGGLGGAASARAVAEQKAARAIGVVVEVMEAKAVPRGAQNRLLAAKLVLDIAGVTAAANAERAVESLLTAMRPHMGEEAYGAAIRALAAVRRLATEPARDAVAGDEQG